MVSYGKNKGTYKYDLNKILLNEKNYCFVEIKSEYYKLMWDIDFKENELSQEQLNKENEITEIIIKKIDKEITNMFITPYKNYVVCKKNKGRGTHLYYPDIIINKETHLELYNKVIKDLKIEKKEKILDISVAKGISMRIIYNEYEGTYYYPLKELSTYEIPEEKEEQIKLLLVNTTLKQSNVQKKINIDDLTDDEEETDLINYKKEIINEKKIINEKGTINENEIIELSEIIKIKYLDNYLDWLNIVWSLQSEKLIKLAIKISKKSTKYTDEGMKKALNNYKEGKITIGTLNYYSMISDKQKYLEIKSKYNNEEINETDNGISKIFIKLFGEEYIYNNGNLYNYNGINWKKDNIMHTLKLKIQNELSYYYTGIINNKQKEMLEKQEYKNEQRKTEINKILQIIKKIQNIKNTNDIAKNILLYIENNEMEFERNEYIFCFNNKVMNLKTCEWIEPNKNDYMYMSTGYDYEEPTEEEINKIKKIIEEIFPIEEERTLYLTILSTGLCGKTLEKFTICNGKGGNGKGLLNGLVLEMFGNNENNYGYTMSNSILLNPIMIGPNPQVANLNNKRIVFCKEPDENQKLVTSTIKELTGESKINARKCNSNITECNLKGTIILECNKKPKMNGIIDDALVRRLIDMLFRSSFTHTPEKYNGEYIYKASDEYKNNEFKLKHRNAIFKILLEYWKNYLKENENINKFIPKSIEERTTKYLQTNDEIYEWFITKYRKIENNTKIIQVSEVYLLFLQSDIYFNYSKKEKRELTKSVFIDKISENVYLRKDYKEVERRKEIVEQYNVLKIRNILIGYEKLNL